jgi:TPR repeat protein
VRSSGSSFLGLEDEGPLDSEYLLTDEEPRGGGAFRALIALAILAVVGYLVLKNWDSPTFAAAIAQIKKTTQNGIGATEPKPQQQSPSTEQPSISTDENATSADAEKQAQKTSPPETQPPAGKDSQNAPASKPEEKSAIPASDSDTTKKDNSTGEKGSSAAEENPNDATDATTPDKADVQPKKSSSPDAAPKTAVPAQDLYERGQAYLSGHGAPQSCDQGVVYTRAAAQQGNPKAAVQMGALYATGRCVSQDRVQAYNWFNEALRNDPNNEYVERSRSTLWAQMTNEERQRATKE